MNRSGATTSILVVEDDPDVRQLVHTLLRRSGYQIDEAVDGEEAIAKLSARRYHVVLLDVMLPRHNGFEVYETIRALTPQPRVIVLSAIARYVGDRFDDDVIVLQKPFTFEELQNALEATG